MQNWERERWTWKRAVRREARLSDAAKVLAAALCDDFANHKTAYCNPSQTELAKALGKSPRSVQRALAELRDAGWIGVHSRRGSGVSCEIIFLEGDGTVDFSAERKVIYMSDPGPKNTTEVSSVAEENTTSVTKKYDRSVVSPCTPYKDKPKINQSARATARPAPQCRACIEPGSDHEREWNAWLTARRFPSLRDMAVRSSDSGGAGWDAPFRLPPRTDDHIETGIAEKWACWAACRMMERRSA